MIDWDRVRELREEMGDGFDEVVDAFLEEVEEVVLRLRAGPQPEDIAREFHFLKGAALNLGFSAFAQQCSAAESAGPATTSSDISAALACYQASRADFMDALGRQAA